MVDVVKRAELVHEMQQLEYDHGGYVIWGFSNFLDGYSSKVQGLIQDDKGVIPLNNFGHGFRSLSFS
jgi:peptide/nickel transport system substrate-binding protein